MEREREVTERERDEEAAREEYQAMCFEKARLRQEEKHRERLREQAQDVHEKQEELVKDRTHINPLYPNSDRAPKPDPKPNHD